ncbi:hypothetical protein ACX0G9_21845 [Flavitalea flava]
MNVKRTRIIFISLAILSIIGSLVVNIIYDKVIVVPKTDTVIDVYGNKKEFTTMEYSPAYKYPRVLGEFFYTLGIAILIFFLIEYTLSNYERNKINKDVFEGVLKKIIPEPLFEIVTNDILYKSFIRKNVVWEYEISNNNTNDGYDLTQLIIYEFCNISNIKVSVPVSISIHQTKENTASFGYFDVQKMDGAKISVSPEDKGSERIFKLDFEPGQTLKVIHHIKISYGSYHVTDCHFTNYSIIGLEIRIRKPADCKFHSIPTFSSNLEILKEDDRNIIYKPVKGLLKGQALVYLLEKEDPCTLLQEQSSFAKKEAVLEVVNNTLEEILTKTDS